MTSCTLTTDAYASRTKPLDIESCRQDIEKAAVAKLLAKQRITIRECLLDAGFCEKQASNKTMQARVRRQIRKLSRRHADDDEEAAVPMEISFTPFQNENDDDISVITMDGSVCAPPLCGTPRPLTMLPTSLTLPPPTLCDLLVPTMIAPEIISRTATPAPPTMVFPTPILPPPPAPLDPIWPLAPQPSPPALGVTLDDLVADTLIKRALEWMPGTQPKRRRIAAGLNEGFVPCF